MLRVKRLSSLLLLAVLGIFGALSPSYGFNRAGDCEGWGADYLNSDGGLGTRCVCATATLYQVTGSGDVLMEAQVECQKMLGHSEPFAVGGSWSASLSTGTYKIVIDIRAYADCSSSVEVALQNDPRIPIPTFLCEGPPQLEVCVAPDVFGLGTASRFSVLSLEGSDLVISEGETVIEGDVGMAADTTGDLLKATINGALFLDPSANPSIHGDLTVTGGVVEKSMSQEHADAIAANDALCDLSPTQAGYGEITKSTTITGGSGTNVINIGAIAMVKKTLTISGSASSVFIFNVTGGFTFSSSKMVLVGGVDPNNIIWNFCGTGDDIDIFKEITVAYGTFLFPYRNMTQDHAVLTGRYIGATAGFQLKIHSAATVKCP